MGAIQSKKTANPNIANKSARKKTKDACKATKEACKAAKMLKDPGVHSACKQALKDCKRS